jgi:O-antigen/teichoic acid export membrane protein
MSLVRGVAKDAVASVARHVATVIAGLVTVPILARSLGASRLGFWSFLGTTAFILSLCDLGLNAATLRASAGVDPSHAKRVARLTAIGTALVAIPAVALAILWLFSVADRLPMDQQHDARRAVLIAMVGGVINSVGQAPRSYAQGQGYLVKLAWARAVAVGVQFIVTVIGLAVGYSLTAVAMGFAVGALIEGLLGLRAAADGVEGRGLPSAAHRPEIRRVAAAGFIGNLAVVMAVRLDVVVLERVADLATIGAYSVAQRIVDQGFTLVKQVSSALVPRLGARSANRGLTIALGTMTLGALAGAPLTALAIAGKPFVVMWAGPAVDLPILSVALVWFAVSGMVIGMEDVATSGMSLGGNALAAARYMMIGSLTNVGLSVAGGLLLGPWAVAAATAIGCGVTAVLVWRATRVSLGWTYAQLRAVLTPPFVAIASAGLTALWLSHSGVPSLAVVLSCSVIGVGLGGLTMWRLLRSFDPQGAL